MTHGYEDSGFLVGIGQGVACFSQALHDSFDKTIAMGGGSKNKKIRLADGLSKARDLFRKAHSTGNKVIFIGNGGSAAIASHMATDYTKNGGIRAVAFNDVPTLTCMANDFGYFNVFSKQLEYYGSKGDVVVTISSSGKSKNILEAAAQAMTMDIPLVTLSGMSSDNPLHAMGDINFYVPAGDYGLIEITHLALLHSIVSVNNLQ